MQCLYVLPYRSWEHPDTCMQKIQRFKESVRGEPLCGGAVLQLYGSPLSYNSLLFLQAAFKLHQILIALIAKSHFQQ